MGTMMNIWTLKHRVGAFAALALAISLVLGCESPVNAPVVVSQGVLVQIDQGILARTLLPNGDGLYYTLVFTADGKTPVNAVLDSGVSKPISLSAGPWALTVKGYLSKADAELIPAVTPVVSGNVPTVEVKPGEIVPVIVKLRPTQTSGKKGTLNYKVTFPNSPAVTIADLTVQKFGASSTSVTVDLLSNTTAPNTIIGAVSSASRTASGVIELDSGYYEVLITLNNGTVFQDGDIAHIYDNLETPAIFTYTDTGTGSRFAKADYSAEGVYVGIISFAGTATDLFDGNLIFLDAAGTTTLTNALKYQYNIASQSGTALFYSVHKAIANLKSNEALYPTNLESVNLITFTDGLDNGSFLQSNSAPLEGQKQMESGPYAAYIGNQITSRTIRGKPITAYSAGVKGGDVEDIGKFTSDLSALASPGKSFKLANYEQLTDQFKKIAEGLNITNTDTTFTMVTTGNDPDTKIRMTFDSIGIDSSAASGSTKYFEGTLTYTAGDPYLTNITYADGFGSTEGDGPIPGTINGSEINFVLTNFQGYNRANAINVKQWTKKKADTLWQRNSEYSVGSAVAYTFDRRSAIIYLVLDASTSLASNTSDYIPDIRNAAIRFIEDIYSQYHEGEISDIYSPKTPTSITEPWILQADGRYKSPAILDDEKTIMRIDFSTIGATTVQIQLDVSSELDGDYALVSGLYLIASGPRESNYSWSSLSALSITEYQYRISGNASQTIAIPVTSAGHYFIDIGYEKNSSGTAGEDRAWFKIEN
ncbi:hypothetical protein TREPR_3472 [Treponema primitia ZAS-2]|uniref:VWFA domain-containing protein n=1 Tax=Treponema primitia (strain ATCC BAA-887 / DSM 12427 / ZAS-2) TaxID=545694 RepID=F5YIZ9_TREPZ|nr:hypothetical protein [Treponema primitia]AEF84537.1 hypothetical protein TREPR_3472 [Treponema primitia ZAS-2]